MTKQIREIALFQHSAPASTQHVIIPRSDDTLYFYVQAAALTQHDHATISTQDGQKLKTGGTGKSVALATASGHA